MATTTGWALRRAEYGLDDGCEGAGQSIPLARLEADRRGGNDPRVSLEERYGNDAGYVRAVAIAARQLLSERLLLDLDVQRYIDDAETIDVLR